MIFACYQKDVQVEISADVKGILTLVLALTSEWNEFELDPPTERAAQIWDGSLRQINVVYSTGNVMVSMDGDRLSFVGAKDKLLILAQSIASLTDTTKEQGPRGGRHIHMEYFPDHFFLHEKALPLIVSFIEVS